MEREMYFASSKAAQKGSYLLRRNKAAGEVVRSLRRSKEGEREVCLAVFLTDKHWFVSSDNAVNRVEKCREG
jgi:hypothetical protein